MVATTATVLRDGKKVKIPIKDIVIGDVVLLSAGDMIPADLRIVEETDLFVRQSTLTGEADSIRKIVENDYKLEEIENIADIETLCFLGTNVSHV